MAMQGRKFNGSSSYRYGMNGMEKDDEVAQGIYTAEYWEYDSRTGRRWNVDPIIKPWESPYACFRGNPIYFADPSGLDGEPLNGGTTPEVKIEAKDLSGGPPKPINTTTIPDTRPEPELKGEAGKQIAFESFPAAFIPTGINDLPVMSYETKSVSSLKELLGASLTHVAIANITGELLNKIKIDPDMVSKQTEIAAAAMTDTRYGKEDYTIYGTVYPTLGGTGDNWFTQAPVAATNNLTWAVRHSDVKYRIDVAKNGCMNIQFRLNDRLDLSPNGSGIAYDVISATLGSVWHTGMGGNRNMRTRGIWNVQISPTSPLMQPTSIPTFSGK